MALSQLQKTVLVALIASVIVAFSIGYGVSQTILAQKQVQPQLLDSEPTPTPIQLQPQSSIARLKLPAVDKDGKGVLAELIVEAREGSGRVFIQFDENNPLINPDTQSSIKIAVSLAKAITRDSLADKNLYFSFNTPSEAVGGKSAGAALAIAAIAAISGDGLKKEYAITGEVQDDGLINPVGSVLQKANAVKNAGLQVLLVPRGESTQKVLREECSEERWPNYVRQECTTITDVVDIEKETGVKIIEVQDVREAYDLMKQG